MTKEEEEEELLELSRQIIICLGDSSLNLTEDEKASLSSILESMEFFTNQGMNKRSIQEAKELLTRLSQIKKR